MTKQILCILSILLVSWAISTYGQTGKTLTDTVPDTKNNKVGLGQQTFKNLVRLKAIIIPSVALGYGFVKLGNNALTNLDIEAKHEFFSEHPHKQFIIDDYMQFAPGVTVFALNGVGVRGKNSLIDQSGIYLLSNIILNGTTQSLKRITAVTRPDGTPNAFPSGHAAEAFASAEFLRREYGDQSVWYTVSGYTAASAVAILRMYNNRHWLSDVVAGAGLGVLSTQASYWLYPKIKNIFSKKSENNTLVIPIYRAGTFSLGVVKIF